MKKTLVRSLFLTTLAVVLPGCVLINTVLGVVGLISTGPIQYAGVAYSVGEYSYEYAVNDKTPDEVMYDKVAWLFDKEEVSAAVEYAEKVNIQEASPSNTWDTAIRLAADKGALRNRTNKLQPALTKVTLAPEVKTPSLSIKKPARAEKQVDHMRMAKNVPTRTKIRRVSPPSVQAIPVVQTVPTPPKHTYIERESDPLFNRLNRMEQAFVLAERVANEKPMNGNRYSIRQNGTGQTITDINGSWSIRHNVMQQPPALSPDEVLDTAPAGQTPEATLQIVS